MESLALIVSIILASALFNLLAGIVLSFIQKKWAKILTIISATLSIILGLTFVVSAEENNNQFVLAAVIITVAIFSVANILRQGLKNDSRG